jgi:hypothetical protein
MLKMRTNVMEFGKFTGSDPLSAENYEDGDD